MYTLEINNALDKKLEKIFKKNKKLFDIIIKKSKEIILNPNHYKNLRKPLNHLKRVHIDKNFVLTFSVNESSKTVTLEDFDHHDKIYK
ncbi:MAG: hypothetical protein IH845_01815 [Nanoarchaeota archaeon]|nr:hypothetical protein [Nanoarchaeota archaeon]